MTNDMAAQPRFTKMHLAKHKTSGAVSFGPIRPKWRCLVICNVKYGNSPTHHISTNTSFLLSRVTLIKMLKHFGSSVFWTLDLESSEYQNLLVFSCYINVTILNICIGRLKGNIIKTIQMYC